MCLHDSLGNRYAKLHLKGCYVQKSSIFLSNWTTIKKFSLEKDCIKKAVLRKSLKSFVFDNLSSKDITKFALIFLENAKGDR